MQSNNAQSGHREPMADRDDRPPKTIQPTSKRDGSRIERTVWAVLLVLPLLAYCVVAMLTYSIKPTPINTGDPLYDKYLAWVAEDLVDNFASVAAHQYLYLSEQPDTNADHDPFAAWETEFRYDPRYWMLRYRYSNTPWAPWENNGGPLESAWDLGVADGAIFLIMLNELDSKYWNNFEFTPSENATDLEYITELVQFNRSKMDEIIGYYHDDVLVNLLELSGDNSLPHYYAAMYDTQRGNYEAAIKNLAVGNRAPINSNMLGFPFENLRSDIQAGKPLPDKTISGSIVVEDLKAMLPNYIQIKRTVKLLVADAVSRDDRAALDEIHTYTCRLGIAEGGDPLNATMGWALVSNVEREFSKQHGSSLNSEQRNNLAKLASVNGTVVSQLRQQGANWQMYNPQAMPWLPKSLWFIEDVLSGGRSTANKTLKNNHEYFVNEQATFTSVSKIFEQLESFNYNTLEFE